MMTTDNSELWYQTITKFIDELDERYLQAYFERVRLALCYQTHLLTANSNEEGFEDALKKISKVQIPLSIKDGKFNTAINKFQEYQNLFIEQGWLIEDKEIIFQIKELNKQNSENYVIKQELIEKYQSYLLTAKINQDNEKNKDIKKEFSLILKEIKKINIPSLIKEDEKFNNALKGMENWHKELAEKGWLPENQVLLNEINNLTKKLESNQFVKKDLIETYRDYLLTAQYPKMSDEDKKDKDKKKEKKDFDDSIKKIKDTDVSKLIQEKNEREFSIIKIADSLKELQNYYQDFTQKGWLPEIAAQIQQIEQEKNFYKLWIYYVFLLADGVTIGTHIAKLTHSSSGASSLIDEIGEQQAGLLTTSSLAKPIYDGTYASGAAMSKYAKFYLLQIENHHKPLGELLKNGDMTPLARLFDENELNQIKQEFNKLLNPPLQADSLAKQVYFPTQQDEYHQLVILRSSALAHEVYQRFFVKSERDKVSKITN